MEPEAPSPIEVLEKKKKKRKYSRGLKDVGRLERGAAKAARRMSRALDRGLLEYRRRSNRSARKRRDGAIRDGLENWSRALGKALRASSRAPYDLVRPITTKRFTRRWRDTLRWMAPPLFR